jgi:signal peptidase I
MRKTAYRVLRLAVRGRREQGGPWGEAVLAEFDHVTTTGEALRWASGGLRVAVRERYSVHPARYRVVAMALATLAAIPFLITVHYVPSHGMEPTIAVTSRHVIDQVAFRVTGIDRGDIVAFPLPDAPSDYETLRRVIGLPGDRIECREGKVLRDGAALDEPYLPFDAEVIGTECAAVTVPEGAIYVLGDNRDVAQDSRHWGVISTDEVTGRVIV